MAFKSFFFFSVSLLGVLTRVGPVPIPSTGIHLVPRNLAIAGFSTMLEIARMTGLEGKLRLQDHFMG